MNISAINGFRVQNKKTQTQKTSFGSFIVAKADIDNVKLVMSSLPRGMKTNFYIYSMAEFLEKNFKDFQVIIDKCKIKGFSIDDIYLTKMEAKALKSGSEETFKDRVMENIASAKLTNSLRLLRLCRDVLIEKGSARSMQNLRRELVNPSSEVYTVPEVCLHGLDILVSGKKVLESPCLGDFMSDIQIEALKGSRNFGNTCLTKEQVKEAKANHQNDMYEYLAGIVKKHDKD